MAKSIKDHYTHEVGTLIWDSFNGEAKVKLTQKLHKMDWLSKADCLGDILHDMRKIVDDLQDMYNSNLPSVAKAEELPREQKEKKETNPQVQGWLRMTIKRQCQKQAEETYSMFLGFCKYFSYYCLFLLILLASCNWGVDGTGGTGNSALYDEYKERMGVAD